MIREVLEVRARRKMRIVRDTIEIVLPECKEDVITLLNNHPTYIVRCLRDSLILLAKNRKRKTM